MSIARTDHQMDSGTRILITGAYGHVGKIITTKLLELGYHINLLDIDEQVLANPDLLEITINHPCCTTYRGSVCEVDTMQQAIKGCATVINLAERLPIGGKQSCLKVLRINVLGIDNILKNMVESGASRLVQISYNLQDFALTMSDGDINHFLISKLAAESFCKAFSSQYDIKVSFVYGGLVMPDILTNYESELLEGSSETEYKRLLLNHTQFLPGSLLSKPDQIACKILSILENI